MSSCSGAMMNSCTSGTMSSEDFDSDACFRFGPSPSPAPEEDDDGFPKDIKDLTGRYRFDTFSGGVWKDISGEGNDVDVEGTFTREMTYDVDGTKVWGLLGGPETSMRFPAKCMGEDKVYTLAYVGKYHGEKRGRIFDGSDVNWLSGWHGNKSGVAYHGVGEWLSGPDPVNITGQALIVGVDQKNLFRLNGVDKTKAGYTSGEAPTQITINDGLAKAGNWGGDGEVSDFLLCEVLIYSRELTVSEIKKIEEYLKKFIPDLPEGTITAKGWEKVSTHVNKEPWSVYSGNQEHCRQIAAELNYKVWGHRNEKHDTHTSRNTCFFYPDAFSSTYADDEADEVHTMGCADPTKDPHNGC